MEKCRSISVRHELLHENTHVIDPHVCTMFYDEIMHYVSARPYDVNVWKYFSIGAMDLDLGSAIGDS